MPRLIIDVPSGTLSSLSPWPVLRGGAARWAGESRPKSAWAVAHPPGQRIQIEDPFSRVMLLCLDYAVPCLLDAEAHMARN